MSLKNSNKEIGKRIAKIRKIKKIKQSELAQKLNIPTNTLGNYERGDRNIPASFIPEVARALNLPSWLITDGIPENVNKYYTYEYFINANDDDWQKYYSELNAERSVEITSKNDEKATVIIEYVRSLLVMSEFEEIDYMLNFVKHEKAAITNKYRLEKLKGNPTDTSAIQFDPFVKLKKENTNIKKKDYRLWFEGTIEHDLNKIVKSLDDGSDLKKNLSQILDRIHREHQDRTFF
ncbi:hypothetical protein LBSP_06460 [Lentilactobacillus buchneri subsp. silagei]|uniref:helix-turn-helix domain-containing protein n=1 Tax=Lentilactobacillus buchneri TaxID=1581 RepID=UPI0012E45962|nr:helix-turn-helix transcriptional regulator [Lentilactobacillus buchneri]GED94086.1 hypothetical protein LBSP_06460 [Lentilactobacillus buchneri subsp. silagei]